jgi:hypothetical protein
MSAAASLSLVTAADFVTVITAAERLLMTKRIVRGHAGPVVRDYDNAKKFDFTTVEIAAGLEGLAKVLDGLTPRQCIVLGQHIDGAPTHNARRLLHPRPEEGEVATLEEAAHHWLPIDLDAIECPSGLDPIANPETAVAYVVRSILPPEMHEAAVYWQLTSGTGFKPGIRMRLVFWCDRPLTGAEVKRWLAGRGGVDGSIYAANQPIYFARPIFDGVEDPVPRRSGICAGSRWAVSPPANIPEAPARLGDGSAGGATVGYETWCRRIGDHAEGEGFFAPIKSAAASWIATNGSGAETAWLRADLERVICEAPRERSVHPDDYIRTRIADLDKLIPRLVSMQAADEAKRPQRNLPTIRLTGGGRPAAAAAGIEILAEAPFYQRDGKIVFIQRTPMKTADDETVLIPSIVPVTTPYLQNELGRRGVWERFDLKQKKWVLTDVPLDVATRIAALPNEWKFLPVKGVIATPTMRRDGTLLTEPGYDPQTGFVLFEPPKMPQLPEKPDKDDAVKALKIISALYDEFPFSNRASRSVALSLNMSLILRPAMSVVPLHVASAPEGGTGKSFIFDIVSLQAYGELCPAIGRGQTVEETEKRLMGAAMEGRTLIMLDNCNGELQSEFLCQAIERPIIQPRPLGTSRMPPITNGFVCGANGNNIEIADDLVRRTLRCELDANMEQPYLREFQNDPIRTISADRGKYIGAVLTIARAYALAGRPGCPTPLASFKDWSNLVRGPLMWLDQEDPVETISRLTVADPRREILAAAFNAIAGAFPDGPFAPGCHVFSPREIVEASKGNETLRNAVLAAGPRGKDDEVSAKSLGWWLRRNDGRVVAGWKLIRQDRGDWALVDRAQERQGSLGLDGQLPEDIPF